MSITNKDLKRRILDISFIHKLSHLGSCLTAVDVLEEIYSTKRPEDEVVLSQGHAGLALYVVLEKHYGVDAEMLFNKHGVHPNRDVENHISCSAGSLGQGLPIALGMALADKSKDIYCMISDGECAEGSIWEALRIKTSLSADNLKIYANLNGYGAYDEIPSDPLVMRLISFDADINLRATTDHEYKYDLPFLIGVNAHYLAMTQEQYEKGLQVYAD